MAPTAGRSQPIHPNFQHQQTIPLTPVPPSPPRLHSLLELGDLDGARLQSGHSLQHGHDVIPDAFAQHSELIGALFGH